MADNLHWMLAYYTAFDLISATWWNSLVVYLAQWQRTWQHLDVHGSTAGRGPWSSMARSSTRHSLSRHHRKPGQHCRADLAQFPLSYWLQNKRERNCLKLLTSLFILISECLESRKDRDFKTNLWEREDCVQDKKWRKCTRDFETDFPSRQRRVIGLWLHLVRQTAERSVGSCQSDNRGICLLSLAVAVTARWDTSVKRA